MGRLSSVVKSPAVQRALYRSGALHAYHRRRNRDRLTVVMFHRVLAPSDPRWPTADPEYSLRDDLFAECLGFFRRHYHVVGLDDVMAARRGGRPLPPCPLLITFDDGWSDTEEFALPHLVRAGMPALLFVVADAVGRREPFFQERMVGAWRAGRLDAGRALALWRDAGGDPGNVPAFGGRDELEPLRELIALLESLAPARRDRLLEALEPVLDDGVRYMATAESASPPGGAPRDDWRAREDPHAPDRGPGSRRRAVGSPRRPGRTRRQPARDHVVPPRRP